ncbi:MAG: efflux RND transporter permease subunit [Candidatus Marinimicrobia bacterium]|nr:efflux RND transporter permease subunit [Candidatus Neomarinimicrobiota bacterium]MCF7829462.1 efflux RND transporter permease subunit [Candidatus Neomarinimicrobiota bacterium]MCF7882341.1 efflux RND transporter permease subunit [Candidatus Neomarinimicrobiota bacterium]
MLTLALCLFGVRAFQQLETALLPDIEYPEYFIVTRFPGGSPEEIEQHVTKPLEEVLASLSGIQDIVSSSREDVSLVEAQFTWESDFQFTLLRIREKIDAVRAQFPEGTERPYIMDFNPNSAPVMKLAVSSDNQVLSALAELSRDVFQPRFSQVEGIASAQLLGAVKPAVQIQVQPDKIRQYRITPQELVQSLRQNIPDNLVSARVASGFAEYPLTVDIAVEQFSDFREMPISPDRPELRLKHVAKLVRKPLPLRSVAYYDSSQVIIMNLHKEAGANTIRATEHATELIKVLGDQYPDISIRVLENRGEFVSQGIHSVQQAILFGAILAFCILLLFLRQIRLSIILSIAIPVSFLVTLIALHIQDITLNLMSLGGLALGIGLILDNGIIVTESIARDIESGGASEPVLSGTAKVARAILGATMTTIAIFFPIIYVRGYASVLFQNQAIVLIYTLIVSLFTALTLLPTAIRVFVRQSSQKNTNADKKISGRSVPGSNRISRLFWTGYRSIAGSIRRAGRWCGRGLQILASPVDRSFQSLYAAAEDRYHTSVVWALNNKVKSGLVAVVILVIALWAYSGLAKRYWPDIPHTIVTASLEVPTSTPYARVRTQVFTSLGNVLRLPEADHVLTQILDPREAVAGNAVQSRQSAGQYHVSFTLYLHEPMFVQKAFEDEIRSRITLPSTGMTVESRDNLQGEFLHRREKNLVIYISGDQTEQLRLHSQKIQNYLREHTNARNIASFSNSRSPVFVLKPDENAHTRYGVTAGFIHDLLRQQVRELKVGDWQDGAEKVPVYLLWNTNESPELARILAFPTGVNAYGPALGQLVQTEPGSAIQDITRVNRKRVISVQADASPHQLSRIVADFLQWQRSRNTPGIEVTVGGESQRIAQSFSELGLALLFAVILVYLLLAAQFESLIHPLNILLTVPMGLIGTVCGLFLFQQSINVIVLIGMVMLIGIGVNDAIVKVDYINYLRTNENFPLRKAVLQTSREKFRPVLMTSLTTIFAMIPMLFGVGGGSFTTPLASTIVGGLLFTTVLTLVYTPVLYEVFEKFHTTRGDGS